MWGVLFETMFSENVLMESKGPVILFASAGSWGGGGGGGGR